MILTMRADLYGQCAANAELAAALSDHHFLIGPMTNDELRRAIELPLQLVGGEFDAGLVDLLLQDVSHQPGALPLLQHALLELWNKREGRLLTVNGYREIGRLEGALQRRADATLKAFSEAEAELCRRIFLRLTIPGEGGYDTTRRAPMQELLSLSMHSDAVENVIRRLADVSLITIEGSFTREDAFVQLVHDALIQNWPQLRQWIEADRAGLRMRTRLTEAARDWKTSGRDESYLYTGSRLVGAEEWVDSHRGELSTEEAEFLQCSRDRQKNYVKDFETAKQIAQQRSKRADEAQLKSVFSRS